MVGIRPVHHSSDWDCNLAPLGICVSASVCVAFGDHLITVDMQGMHKGWIYCRENEDACVDFVTPEGQDSSIKAIQRYNMREVMHSPASGV
jgi:hypothetical protein